MCASTEDPALPTPYAILDAYDQTAEPLRFLLFVGCVAMALALGAAADLALGTGFGSVATGLLLCAAGIIRAAHLNRS